MLILQQVGYRLPNTDFLFSDINLTLNKGDKYALVGNNGSGKSTLLSIIAGNVQANEGNVLHESTPYLVPQHFGQLNHLNIAEALHIYEKMKALQHILAGDVAEQHFHTLDDDWDIEERCRAALDYWGLQSVDMMQPLSSLSGGEKTRVFLSGLLLHEPLIVLMDEPSNHLDKYGRALLYQYMEQTNAALIVVSHDRQLLQLLPATAEINKQELKIYGGNYSFYKEQKRLEQVAWEHDLKDAEKALRKAKAVERESMERQQKLDARGKKKQEKAGTATIMMNTLRNNAEKSTARTKDTHTEKVGNLSQNLQDLRKEQSALDQMKLELDNSALYAGKTLIIAKDINVVFYKQPLWEKDLNLQINSGERWLIAGKNGTGKTTLIKLILGSIKPNAGVLHKTSFSSVYIDQDYSLIRNDITVLEQAQLFNQMCLPDHQVKIRLTHFLFDKAVWDKSCSVLSGGEKMRLLLCCLMLQHKAPDLIILDEPTNNLDVQNIEILTTAIKNYKGTLLLISHDQAFVEDLDCRHQLVLGH